MRKYQINFLDPDKKPLIIEAESFKVTVEKSVKDRADLREVDLRKVDLRKVDLREANLRGADLRGADLRGADLRGADLYRVNLFDADLRGADLDYSTYPLWCGSLNMKIDKRIFCQLLYHTVRAGKSVEDEEVQAFLNNPDVLKLANQFHRVEECGKLEPRQGKVKR